METIEIAAELRQATGKHASRNLRRNGRLPGTFYGPKRSAVSIEVDAKEFTSKVANIEGSHLIRLRSGAQDVGDRVALIRDLQYHPVTGAVVHADFYEVDMTQKLNIKVPLHFVGKPVGVTQQGGILQPIQREVEVLCLPTDIPPFIEVDVSSLGIHDAIHIADLSVPEGVELRFDTNLTLVTVLPPTVEEVKVEAAAAEVPVEGAAPATEGAAAPAAGAKPEGSKGGAA